MSLLIQTLAKVVAKNKFGSCLIAKLRGQLLHFSFILKFLHVGFFFRPGDRIFVCLDNCTIPHNRCFFTAQFASQNPHNFLFFSLHHVRRPEWRITIKMTSLKVSLQPVWWIQHKQTKKRTPATSHLRERMPTKTKPNSKQKASWALRTMEAKRQKLPSGN